MVEVMTDKATVTITAPKSGTMVETRGKVGEVVKVHAVLVVFELGGGAAAAAPGAANGGSHGNNGNGHAAKDDGPAATAVGDIRRACRAWRRALPSRRSRRAASGAVSGYFNDKPLATPATRKLARDMSVDLRQRAADRARRGA